MLQKLDTEHLNRLALAEALSSMEPRDFDMRRPDRCICGHALRLFGIRLPYFGGWESQLGAGANLLGLSIEQARELFAPVNRAKATTTTPTRRMRHEWCDISRPPIPLIGAWLGSFNQYTSSAGSAHEARDLAMTLGRRHRGRPKFIRRGREKKIPGVAAEIREPQAHQTSHFISIFSRTSSNSAVSSSWSEAGSSFVSRPRDILPSLSSRASWLSWSAASDRLRRFLIAFVAITVTSPSIRTIRMPLTCGRFQSHGKPPSRSSPPDAEFTKEYQNMQSIRPFDLARTMISGSVS